ncbi:MAG: hypothetical protein J0I57_05110 [Hyphomicrobium sp.]|nr:hypothetical protein [Hyphomicrobium sp.]
MSKLPIALAALAMATVSSIPLSTEADAGRGFRGHFRFHHFGPPMIRHEEPVYVYRKPRVVRRPVAAPAPAPVVKFADGEGRVFDRASKTWFDGSGSCWKGNKTFAYRSGAWFYGNARWVQTSNGWGVSSGEVPEQIDCADTKAFAGKIKPVAAAPEASPAEAAKPVAAAPPAPAPVEVAKPASAKEVPARAPEPKAARAEPKAPETTANASDCKKYLPSLGETVSVPCTQ